MPHPVTKSSNVSYEGLAKEVVKRAETLLYAKIKEISEKGIRDNPSDPKELSCFIKDVSKFKNCNVIPITDKEDWDRLVNLKAMQEAQRDPIVKQALNHLPDQVSTAEGKKIFNEVMRAVDLEIQKKEHTKFRDHFGLLTKDGKFGFLAPIKGIAIDVISGCS